MQAIDVKTSLDKYFSANSKYVAPNIYFFERGYGETDYLVVKESGMIYDIEIKVSRSDYLADFGKKDKHDILSKGTVTGKHFVTYNRLNNGKIEPVYEERITPVTDRPNRFYFALPENMVGIHEIPKYAGLFYIKPDGKLVKAKEAPLLHKEILKNTENRLCRKFYFHAQHYYAIKAVGGVNGLKREINELKDKVFDLEYNNRILEQKLATYKEGKDVNG